MDSSTARSDKQAFSRTINDLLAKIRLRAKESNGVILDDELVKFQNKLDALAGLYQHNERLGLIRYKLYFTQALLHYYRGEDDQVLRFLDMAEVMRGGAFSASDDLRQRLIAHSPAMRSNENQTQQDEQYVGISGWLVVFLISLAVGFGFNLYNFFDGLDVYSSLTADITSAYPSLQTLLGFETLINFLFANLAALVFILILMKQRIAKPMAIFYVAGILVFSVIIYFSAYSIFADDQEIWNEITQDNELFRSFVYASIWIPYFLMSKRVRSTLTK